MTTKLEIMSRVAEDLRKEGTAVEFEVQCGEDVIDMITANTIYEIKPVLTAANISAALVRLTHCRETIQPMPRAIIIGGRSDGNLGDAIREAESYHVEIVILDQ